MSDVSKVASSDGVALYIESSGPGPSANNEAAPCIVFSCAYTTTHENWRGQVEPLVADT